MPYTLTTASEAVRKSKSTILRAIQSGRLSATRDDATSGWLIDGSELFRVYPTHSVAHDGHATSPLRPRNGPLRVRGATAALQAQLETAEVRVADKEAQLAEARSQIDDLRRRLDRADEQRQQAQTQLAGLQTQMAALLTDQRPTPPAAPPHAPRRTWWSWRR